MGGPVAQQASAWESDDETRSALTSGLTVAQLAVAFEQGPQVVARKLAGVAPTGKRGRFATYRLSVAAPHLVEPTGDFEATIRRMNHRDLPPMLLKETYQGLRSRQAFLEQEGDLWRTEPVLSAFTDAFKAVRLGLMLLADTIEREDALTERQRERLVQLVDAALEDCRGRLIKEFRRPDRTVTPPGSLDADADGEADDAWLGGL
jgi:hypothetical protein